jgi:drug/metabolite transporter (DMT)-like permease
MNYYLALAAAVGCAVCNGSAVILEKIGVNEEKKTVKLLENLPYMLGIVLDIIGWLLTLIAVRTLPLFLVQSIIAANIVIAALLDQLILRRRLPKYGYRLIFLILAGLIVLAFTAAPTTTVIAITPLIEWASALGLLLLGGIAVLLVRRPARTTAIALAVIAGIAFGAISIVGRLLITNVAFWQLFHSPLMWILIAYSGLGMLCLTLGLRHATATTVNAVSVTFQTVAPTVIGLALLGDSVRTGSWWLTAVALLLTLIASLTLASLHTTFRTRIAR